MMINITALCLALVIVSLIIRGLCREFIPNTTYKKYINNFISVVCLMYLGAISGVYLERENTLVDVVVEEKDEYTFNGMSSQQYELLKSVYRHGIVHGSEAALYCPEREEESLEECVERHINSFNGTGVHKGRR